MISSFTSPLSSAVQRFFHVAIPANPAKIEPERAMGTSANEAMRWANKLYARLRPFDLRGTRVQCPVCGKRGIAGSRWIRGPTVKPVYVLHDRRKTIESLCGLTEKQARQIRARVKITKYDLSKILQRAKCFVLISGGDDSLATLIHTQKIATQIGADFRALHVETGVGFPQITTYVRRICRQLGIKLSIARPDKDFFDLAAKWGIPSIRFRWCCRELKINPIRDLLARLPGLHVVIDGIRAQESNQRAKYLPLWYHPGFKCLSVSPIFRWTNQRVTNYVRSAGLPQNPAHQFPCSAECFCGAYATPTTFRHLKQHNPALFERLSNLEKKSPTGYTFLYKNHRRLPLAELV